MPGTAGAPLLVSETPIVSVEVEGSTAPYWKDIYGQMLRTDLALFAKDILGLEIGPHMLEWADLTASKKRLCILAARDHSKTSFFSYAYPIWRAWTEPGCEVYLFSSTLEQAQEFVDIIVYGRNNLRGMLNTPELGHLVPQIENLARDRRLRLNRADVRLTNGSRIRVAGYGKAMRGRHPKYIVLDDVLNDEDMWSEIVRKKNIEYFKSAIVNMVAPDGQLILIGTPYQLGDLYNWVRQNKTYTFRTYPGIIKDPKTGIERALFPWRWPLEALYRKREEIQAIAFAREILCIPLSDDVSIFPSYLFPPLFDDKLRIRPSKAEIEARGWTVYFGVDIARSASVGADFFVIFCLARDNTGQHFIVDIRRSKGLPFRQQLHEIEVAAHLYDPALILIESNAMQQVYTDEMRRMTDLPVKEFVTLATNKYPLDRGVPGLRILLEGKKLTIPRGDEESVRVTDSWMTEMQQFGYIDGKLQGIGENDDMVMACVVPGALVTTKKGLAAIEDVREGDEVLTHLGRWRRVAKTMSRQYDGVVKRIHPSGSNSFSVTPEHPVYRACATEDVKGRTNRLQVGEWGFVPAEDVRAGRKKQGHWLLNPVPVWDGVHGKIDLAQFVDNRRAGPRGAQPWRQRRLRLASRIDCQNRPAGTKRDGGPWWKILEDRIWWRSDRVLPRFLDTADPDWWFLLGLYLAESVHARRYDSVFDLPLEGSTGGRSAGGFREECHLVHFGLHERETYIVDFLRSAADKFFAAPVRTWHEGHGQIATFGSVPAARLFSQFGKCHEKSIPWEWMGADNRQRLLMVRGWLVGDGSMGWVASDSGASYLTGMSSSRTLIEQMRVTLMQAGFSPRVRPMGSRTRFGGEKGDWQQIGWTLSLSAQDSTRLIESPHPVEQERWADFVSSSKRLVNIRTKFVDGGLATRVRKIEDAEYHGLVYNLHVEEDNSYVVEGMAVHNCWLAREASLMGNFSFAFGDDEKLEEDVKAEDGGGERWEDVFIGPPDEKDEKDDADDKLGGILRGLRPFGI